MKAYPTQPVSAPLGIIAGSGDLPERIVGQCKQQNRPVFVLAFEGNEVSDALTPDARVRFGAIGEALNLLRQAGVQDVVLAGRITRPSLADLRPDAMAARLLARIGTAFFSGDDSLLAAIVAFLEEEGFRVLGADEILGDILAPQGLVGHVLPDKQARKDIELGAKAARALGALDVGQAVIVQRGMVLGVEAVEGTDALIARCGLLKVEGGGGVLVKMKKPAQERRVDLPTIGIATVENMYAAGFAGIALEAGGSQIIDKTQVSRHADALGIFILGFSYAL